MKTTLPALAAATLAAGLALAAVAQDPKPKEAAAPNANEAGVRARLGEFLKAFNDRDEKALGEQFADDAVLVDAAGETTSGREAIVASYADAFGSVAGLALTAEIGSIRMLTDDVAQVEGTSRLAGGQAGDAVQLGKYTALLVRKDGQWRLADLRDQPEPEPDITPAERLSELEWMLGDWVDESEEVRVRSSIRWADNRSFLVRTYSVEIPGEAPRTGTMFIGWDPQTRQFKSWVFDSEGGHGEGLWTRAADDQWIVRAHGVLRDGRPTSATQVHTVVSKDAVKTSSFDRIIGGQLSPDINEVMMVRKPPAPEHAPAGSTPKDKD